jgi:hypothetical protein
MGYKICTAGYKFFWGTKRQNGVWVGEVSLLFAHTHPPTHHVNVSFGFDLIISAIQFQYAKKEAQNLLRNDIYRLYSLYIVFIYFFFFLRFRYMYIAIAWPVTRLLKHMNYIII